MGARAREQAKIPGSYDAGRFERPSVAVDVALLSAFDGALSALLVRRREAPAQGRWALPGGFVGIKESLDDAARRVLSAKAGIVPAAGRPYLEQLYTFGEPGRDPRTRIITVAYYALVHRRLFEEAAAAGTGAAAARLVVPWEGETGGPVEALDAAGGALDLAFDHDEILGMAVRRIRGKLDYTPIGFQLLPEEFSLRGLQEVHETVLGRPLNKDSFRRRMLASGMLEATGRHERDAAHRPAELYRFTRRAAV
jgi:8-oxo-dGTP diphosphatase